MQGVSPSKTFGEESKRVLQKDVTITASGEREVATFAGGMTSFINTLPGCL